MKKKKLLGIMTAVIIMSLSAPVYATEQEIQYSEGSEEYIYPNETAPNELNTCQIIFNGVIPEGMVNAYVIAMNMETETMYQVPLTIQNDYVERLYVPAGSYRIVEMSFYDDNVAKYPFNPVDDFTLTDAQNITIEVKPIHYDDIKKELDDRVAAQKKENCELCNSKLNEEGFCTNEDCIQSQNTEEEVILFPEVESDIDVVYSGTNPVALGITGTPLTEAYVIVKISKNGAVGEAYFQISYDNGLTWSDETLIPLSGKIPTDYGTTLVFEGTRFQTGDTFTAFYPNPEKTVDTNKRKNTQVEYVELTSNSGYVYDIMIANQISLSIEIRKNGAAGEGVFAYSLDNGVSFSQEYLIPDDGKFTIPEYDITIEFHPDFAFYDSGVNMEFTAKAEKGINIIGIGILIGGLLIGWNYIKGALLKKKTPNSTYVLNKYQKFSKKERKVEENNVSDK